ncbi:MAG: oligopeptide transporter, OPT family [Gemmatimonadales bacterium]|nr:oligopeptide transporter, OPT family [Gemmatimonadales bacterium]MDQ3426699.1 oligopeptide transporter, OPT family [Gemmatimonadota bacterium]
MATIAPPKSTSEAPQFQPYIPPSQSPAELTLRAVLLGAVLGIVFAASSVYLALKIGLTVSASIPIAVLAVAFFRTLGKSTILENNIVQTTGSAGESIAAGVVFTLPAILLMGYDLTVSKVAVIALVGGLLGILLMIPLRRALIVKEHGRLTYPEGTACAEVLVAGDKGGLQARLLFQAFGLAFVYKFLMAGLRLWKEVPGRISNFYQGASISAEVSPELLGVGYIIGPRIAGYLFAGGSLAYLVLIPAIKLFGSGLTQPIFAETKLIRDMSPNEVRAEFVFYIGAGAVASAGIIALLRSLPTIVGAFRAGFQDLRGTVGAVAARARTDIDLPIWLTPLGALALALILTIIPQVAVNLLGAILIIIFGFFFVVVSSRITGVIGVSANPISGMTIAALIGTASIFLLIGWTGVDHRVGAISIAAVIAVSAALAGTTSQDLKTGFLVGATPRRQQIAIMVGAITSALAIGWTLTLLNTTYTNIVPERHPGVALQAAPEGAADRSVTSMGERMQHEGREWEVVRVNIPTEGIVPGKYLIDPESNEVAYLVDPGIGGRVREIDGQPVTKLDSPKATIMALVTDGILTQRLPWGLVLIGVFLTIAIELMGLQSLPIAVGVYLPISTSSAMFAGGAVRWLVERKMRSSQRSIAEVESGPGVLFASGLIAGGAIAGVAIAGVAAMLVRQAEAAQVPAADYLAHMVGLQGAVGSVATSDLAALAVFSVLAAVLYRVARR